MGLWFLFSFAILFLVVPARRVDPQGPPVTLIERNQVLSPRLNISWTVDLVRKSIEFKLTAQTNGYIVFGISKKRSLKGEDVIVGGVQKKNGNSKIYFWDGLGVNATGIKKDKHQDWTILEGTEIENVTQLRFNRPLITWLSPLRVTTGSFPITSEMCMAFLLFYPKLNNPLDFCGSQQFAILPSEFGVTNFDMTGDEMVISGPVELKGQNYDLHVTKKVNWTREYVEEVQEKSRYGEHMGFCHRGSDLVQEDGNIGIDLARVSYGVQYPIIDTIYREPDTCAL